MRNTPIKVGRYDTMPNGPSDCEGDRKMKGEINTMAKSLFAAVQTMQLKTGY